MKGVTIPESHLLEYTRCPLRLQESIYADDMKAGMETLKWLLLEEFHGRRPSLAQLRERFEFCMPTKSRKVLLALPGICRKLRDLLDLHGVFQPATDYLLSFGQVEVTGRYAVLLSGKKPLILRLHEGLAYPYPDVMTVARWMHFRRFEQAYPRVDVIHYSLATGSYTRQLMKERMVRYLESAVHAYVHQDRDQEAYPVPSSYCDTCQAKVCIKGAGDGRHGDSGSCNRTVPVSRGSRQPGAFYL